MHFPNLRKPSTYCFISSIIYTLHPVKINNVNKVLYSRMSQFASPGLSPLDERARPEGVSSHLIKPLRFLPRRRVS